MNKTEVKKPSVHTITRPLPEVLGTIIKLLEQEVISFDSYSEMANAINKRFNLSVTEDDLVKYYSASIEIQDAELMYGRYGYG